MSDVYPVAAREMAWMKKTFERNSPEQAITFDNAIGPVGQEEEESQRVEKALLVMKNCQEGEPRSDPRLLNQQCTVQCLQCCGYIRHCEESNQRCTTERDSYVTLREL